MLGSFLTLCVWRGQELQALRAVHYSLVQLPETDLAGALGISYPEVGHSPSQVLRQAEHLEPRCLQLRLPQPKRIKAVTGVVVCLSIAQARGPYLKPQHPACLDCLRIRRRASASFHGFRLSRLTECAYNAPERLDWNGMPAQHLLKFWTNGCCSSQAWCGTFPRDDKGLASLREGRVAKHRLTRGQTICDIMRNCNCTRQIPRLARQGQFRQR